VLLAQVAKISRLLSDRYRRWGYVMGETGVSVRGGMCEGRGSTVRSERRYTGAYRLRFTGGRQLEDIRQSRRERRRQMRVDASSV
jgi:hypothetical protein